MGCSASAALAPDTAREAPCPHTSHASACACRTPYDTRYYQLTLLLLLLGVLQVLRQDAAGREHLLALLLRVHLLCCSEQQHVQAGVRL
jgi:hypothetical protein